MIYRLIRLCRILAVVVIGAAFALKGLASVLSQVLAAWRSGRQTDLPADLTKPESSAGQNDARKIRRAVFVTLLGFGLLAGIGGLLVVVSGLVPIAASSGHWPITEWFLKFAMNRSVSTHSLGIHTPPLNDPDLVVKGGAYYEIGCRPCHGSPGLAQPRIASRMVPPPPDLVRRAGELEARELFYIVKHGVKFTGMPAWPSLQRDDEVWAVVAFLKTLAHLDKEAYQQLVRGHSPSTSQMLSLDE
ncbi:MAG TPA: cytochrome c, partial [Terrimicrobiaceae bacterium]